jgi:hypothetical protein
MERLDELIHRLNQRTIISLVTNIPALRLLNFLFKPNYFGLLSVTFTADITDYIVTIIHHQLYTSYIPWENVYKKIKTKYVYKHTDTANAWSRIKRIKFQKEMKDVERKGRISKKNKCACSRKSNPIRVRQSAKAVYCPQLHYLFPMFQHAADSYYCLLSKHILRYGRWVLKLRTNIIPPSS